MITSLRLVDFKNFADETLHVGPFTVIVGANASARAISAMPSGSCTASDAATHWPRFSVAGGDQEVVKYSGSRYAAHQMKSPA